MTIDLLDTLPSSALIGFNNSELRYLLNRMEAVNAAAHLGLKQLDDMQQHDPLWRHRENMRETFEADIIASGAILNKIWKAVGGEQFDYSQGPRK